MDTTELKKKLAKLKKEYKNKEIVLKKVERRVDCKAHVKKRVEEEAKKTAENDCQISARKPVKVKFEEKLDQKNVYEKAKEEKQDDLMSQPEEQLFCNFTVNYVPSENSQGICSQDTINEANIDVGSQMQLIDSEDKMKEGENSKSVIEPQCFKSTKEKGILGCGNFKNTPDIYPSEEKVHITTSCHVKTTEVKLYNENSSDSALTTLKPDVSTSSLKNHSPSIAHMKRLNARESQLDFSFLDEEKNDLYSQIKSRKRRARESPSFHDSVLQSSSQRTKRIRSPKVATASKEPFKASSEKKTESELPKEAPSGSPSVLSSFVKEIFEKLSSSSDLASQEHFSLPQELVNEIKPTVEVSLSSDSEKTCCSLPADMKIHSKGHGAKYSPLNSRSVDISSQIDFKSHQMSSRKHKFARKVKPLKAKQKKIVKHGLTSTVSASKEQAADLKTDCPIRHAGSFNAQDLVLQVACCDEGILTCTSSAATLWNDQDGGWTALFTVQADNCETFEACKMLTSGSARALVVASRNLVSFVYRLVPFDEAHAPIVMHEVPFLQVSQSSQFLGRVFICAVSPTDLLLSQPHGEHRQQSQLMHVALAAMMDEVTARRSIPAVPSKLSSLVPIRMKSGGCSDVKLALGASTTSVYIWNVTACSLIREITAPYKIIQCAGAVAEQGVLFVACSVDDPAACGGGLFAINPATGCMALVTKLEPSALWERKNKRWHYMAWHNRFICASAPNCKTAVFSAYSGHLVAHTSDISRLSCLDMAHSRAVFASKTLLQVFNLYESVLE